MDFLLQAALAGGPSLLAAVCAPKRWLLAALALLTLVGGAMALVFLNFEVVSCGGEICLINGILAIVIGLATLLADLILLTRWLWLRRQKSQAGSES